MDSDNREAGISKKFREKFLTDQSADEEGAQKEASARKKRFFFLILLPRVLNFCMQTYFDLKR